MTPEEKKSYQALFDDTKQFIARGKKHLGVLGTLPPSETRDALLNSTQKILKKLREEADEIEKLGWGNNA